MSVDIEDIYAKMAKLRGPYLSQVAERVLLLEKHAAALACHAPNDESREELKFIAHKFAGTGSIYGYPAISATGRALEQAIMANPGNAAEILQLTEALIAACQEARRAA